MLGNTKVQPNLQLFLTEPYSVKSLFKLNYKTIDFLTLEYFLMKLTKNFGITTVAVVIFAAVDAKSTQAALVNYGLGGIAIAGMMGL